MGWNLSARMAGMLAWSQLAMRCVMCCQLQAPWCKGGRARALFQEGGLVCNPWCQPSAYNASRERMQLAALAAGFSGLLLPAWGAQYARKVRLLRFRTPGWPGIRELWETQAQVQYALRILSREAISPC